MSVYFETDGSVESCMWYVAPDGHTVAPDGNTDEVLVAMIELGELPRLGVDEHDPIGLDEALWIADYYGGGEFDDETAGIIAALCVLRDHIKGLTS